MKLDSRSLQRLAPVHEDLRRVTMRAAELSPLPFIVTEGLRSAARQKALVASGASLTLRSRHLTGHAIDFAPLVAGKVTWKWPPFALVAASFKQAARECGVAIVWGGDWKRLRDGPHIELDRRVYREERR